VRTISLAVAFALLCASVSAADTRKNDNRRQQPVHVSTNNQTLEIFLDELMSEYSGETGRWTFNLYDVDMVLITDEDYDRMRLMAPIADAPESMASEHLRELLEANFDRALDAKYAIWRETVWATYVHPLSELTKHELQNAIRQVAALTRNYGSSYSSTEFQYGDGR